MRYRELIEGFPYQSLGLCDPANDEFNIRRPDDTRKPKVTLRMINRLKRQRQVQKKHYDKKMELVRLMYADDELRQQSQDQQLEDETQKHELEMAKLKFDSEQLKLRNEIEKAEIDYKQKSDIRQKAQAVAARSLKDG